MDRIMPRERFNAVYFCLHDKLHIGGHRAQHGIEHSPRPVVVSAELQSDFDFHES